MPAESGSFPKCPGSTPFYHMSILYWLESSWDLYIAGTCLLINPLTTVVCCSSFDVACFGDHCGFLLVLACLYYSFQWLNQIGLTFTWHQCEFTALQGEASVPQLKRYVRFVLSVKVLCKVTWKE